MKTYTVRIREVHSSVRVVEAASPDEALDVAGSAAEASLEYEHTLDRDTWTVYDEEGELVHAQGGHV